MTRTRSLWQRRGFTRTDLAVAMVLVLLGGGVLLASVMKVNNSAAREQSANQLKQLWLAVTNCAETNAGKMPPGLGNFYPNNGLVQNNSYGPCLFHILPYIEEGPLYTASQTNVGMVTLYASWTGAGKTVKVYHAPGDPTAATAADSTSYLANALAFPQEGARYPVSFTDGTSNTILFAEGYARAVGTLAEGGRMQTWPVQRRWWDVPVWFPRPSGVAYQLAPAPEAADARLPQGFTKEGIQVAMADGMVKLVAPGCSATTFFFACTPNGGEPLGSDW